MTGLTPHALAVLRAHHGVATTTMLRRAGVGRAAIVGLIERGVLVREHERVVRIASSPATLLSRCAGMCLAYPAAFVTGPTAGKLTGLRRMPRPDPIHLCVRHGSNVGPLAGVVLRQSTSIHPSDVQSTRPDGIRLASPPRLAFDLGADLVAGRPRVGRRAAPPRGALHVRHAADHRPPADSPAATGIAVVADDARSPRGDGRRPSPTPSCRSAEALRALDVPVEVVQIHLLDLPNGGRARLDIAVPGMPLGHRGRRPSRPPAPRGHQPGQGRGPAVPPDRLADRAGDAARSRRPPRLVPSSCAPCYLDPAGRAGDRRRLSLLGPRLSESHTSVRVAAAGEPAPATRTVTSDWICASDSDRAATRGLASPPATRTSASDSDLTVGLGNECGPGMRPNGSRPTRATARRSASRPARRGS